MKEWCPRYLRGNITFKILSCRGSFKTHVHTRRPYGLGSRNCIILEVLVVGTWTSSSKHEVYQPILLLSLGTGLLSPVWTVIFSWFPNASILPDVTSCSLSLEQWQGIPSKPCSMLSLIWVNFYACDGSPGRSISLKHLQLTGQWWRSKVALSSLFWEMVGTVLMGSKEFSLSWCLWWQNFPNVKYLYLLSVNRIVLFSVSLAQYTIVLNDIVKFSNVKKIVYIWKTLGFIVMK